MGRLSPRFHRLWGSEGVGSERSRSSRGQMEGEFFGLRDWRHGDSQRWIHWRTSARRDQLAVREFEQQHDPLLALVLDLWIPKLAEPADLETVELAISFAASVAAEHCSRGGSRMIISAAAAKGFRLTGGASTGFLDEVLENLAIVEPSNQNHLGEMVEQTFAKSRQITRSLIVTTRKRLDIDGDEFAQISHDSEHRKTLKSAKIISAAREDFARFIELE